MRAFSDILSAIRSDFVNNLTLQDMYSLDTTKTFEEQFSVVSLESILTYIVATAIYLYESIINDSVTDIESQIADEYPFSIAWYYEKALAFQLGDALEYDESTYKFNYATVDTDKQIVKYVAVRQVLTDITKLRIYATKDGKAALSADELAAFEGYIKQICAAGTHFEFISLAPNQLELNLNVTYNPQILSGSGTQLSDGLNTVETAIESYLNGVKYGGTFNRTKCVDAVQLANGVVDVVLNDVKMDGDLNNSQSFESSSGFFNAQTINVTYTPSVDN